MDKMRLFIITHNRPVLLNQVLHHLSENTDFSRLKDTRVYILNDAVSFKLDDCFKDRVICLHSLRPPWMISNLAETHNRALVMGFGSLVDPQTEIVTHIHDDTFLHPNWVERLLALHEKYSFVVGNLGDGVISYKAEAVRRIGMWDENFVGIQHKEADYYIRALQWNKEHSSINDRLHDRILNSEDVVLEQGNSVFSVNDNGDRSGRNIEDKEYSKDAACSVDKYLLDYFASKWDGTGDTDPEYNGWVLNWSKEFVDNPPRNQDNVTIFARYPHFEKDIYDLETKNYFNPDGLRRL